MTDQSTHFSEENAWAAVMRRDRAWDGRFVTGVLSTGIYCRPSCAARHPARSNVRFFANGEAAGAAGLRACLRCLPDDVTRDEAAMAAALNYLGTAEDRPSLEDVAAVAGYAPHHFHRLFKRVTGVTPAAYVRGLRAKRARAALDLEPSITGAIYEAGYSTPSRFYADSNKRLGMMPSVWKNGGRGVTIRWAIADTSLGPMLVAATEKGICRLSFDENAEGLQSRFPHAEIVPGGPSLDALVADAVAAVDCPTLMPSLPLDVRGTAFQEAIWQELCRVPPGETVTYTTLAERAGNPRAVRAAGSACGANPVAVLIPCHRAKRTDGSLGGYAYGLDRKQRLLKTEAEA